MSAKVIATAVATSPVRLNIRGGSATISAEPLRFGEEW